MCIETIILTGIALASILAAIIVTGMSRRRERRQLNSIQMMLDLAIDGTFQEYVFDESLLSAVETRFAQYLAASSTITRNVSEEKNKIQELIADISHQTKTPIANILLYAQLLREQALPEESQTCVSALNDQAEKLQFLIESLVKMSRLETGILTLKPENAAIQPMLDSIREQVAHRAEEKAIVLTVEPTTAMARFDEKWTTEAVYNVVDNAVKYTPCGGRILIQTVEYELFCCINITDNGAGIPEEEQTKVFQRFYRSQTVGGAEGLGIGLYLTRQILSEEDGYIKLRSKPGRGTTFSVFLIKE
ncbi:MAG: sensor histidine kinase [Oscillospiraceae bacterium]|jgi:signal transduction histidine kinase